MRPAEIVHRVGEQCALKILQVRHRMGWASPAQLCGDAGTFSFCAGSTRRLPELPWAFDPDAETVGALLDGRGGALGFDWRWRPEESVWHEAPDTRMTWPRIFFGLIPYRQGNPYGDVRVVWEPSRLQHLIALGLLARDARPGIRRQAAALLRAQLVSWVEANPYLTGVHYISAMECGLRVLAVCHAVDLARGAWDDSDPVWPALLSVVLTHAELIAKRVSRHSSTGNHTIAEAAALAYAGTLFPEMAAADRWRALGLSLLEQEVAHQILPDGGGVEQAFWYQAFIVDLYGLVIALLRHHHQAIPSLIVSAFARGRDFLGALSNAPDQLPQIGDADGGYALSPYLRVAWSDRPWSPGLTVFSDAGYSLIRGGEEDRAVLLFDHGPLGMPPCHGHGHADALSVVFRLGEKDLLLDPGTYTYAGDARWRAYFRGTPAHNTVTVDELDQAVQETPFLWSRPYSARIVRREQTTDGIFRILARHDGYAQRVGVTHWRAVSARPSGSWLVWDRLTGKGFHKLELNWQLGVEPVQHAGGYRLPSVAPAVSLSITGGAFSVCRGRTEPIAGWRSRGYGVKEPITTIRTQFEGPLPHEFVTHIQVGPRSLSAECANGETALFREWVDAAQAH